MKMLTGLLPPSEGEALLFGQPLDARRHERALPRRLHVAIVLALHRTDGPAEPRTSCASFPPAGAEGEGAHRRAGRTVRPRGLSRSTHGSDLPLGIRQRLSLAVAIVHEPEMLILDEPTSGVDPLARDRFWELLIDLSRNQGVTIFVSTHFMNEAERCDRISLMDSGRVLATGTPAESDQGPWRRHARRRLYQLSRGGDGITRFRDRGTRPAGRTRKSGASCRRRSVPGSACSACSPIRSARPWSCCATRSGSGSACSAPRC